MKGTVRRVVAGRGFGFITAEGDESEYFFHRNEVKGEFLDLTPGTLVYFSPQEDSKGLRAIEIKVSREVGSEGFGKGPGG
jgi:CspA family cold shock protein